MSRTNLGGGLFEQKSQKNPKRTADLAEQLNCDVVLCSWTTSNNKAFWIPCEDG